MKRIMRKIWSCAAVLTLTANSFVAFAADTEKAQAEKTEQEKKAAELKKAQEELLLDENAYKNLMDFLTALAIVKTNYADADKVTYERLFKAALRGMMHELDPFSNYESPEMFKETQEETKGEMAGIGIMISLKNRALEVVSTYPDGPSEKAGIRPGDIITEIDTEPVQGKDMRECLKKLRGKPGTQIRLRIYRGQDDSIRNFTVTRAILAIRTVTGEKMLDGGVGYLRITQFSGNTTKELDEALEKLDKQGMSSLIIDVRGNPGGLLDQAVKVCSRFLTPGKPVVSVEGREDKKNITHKSITCKAYPELPVAILVNGNSASAAEIVTACLQDYKRAVVVGERTFGKGSVQTIVPFGKNEALRITIAKYFTPGRRPIHGHGIPPDITVPLSNAQRFLLSAQLNQFPGIIQPPAPNTVRDIQLERALEVLKAVRLFRNTHAEAEKTAVPEKQK